MRSNSEAPPLLWLARHGETTWNLEGRYQGRMESALSGLGMRQGMALGAAFHARLIANQPIPTRVVASPLLRCTTTAQLAAERLGVPVETDERLVEIAHGTWEGRLRDDLARDDPERYRAWRVHPDEVAFEGGERLSDVMQRWRSFARDAVASEEHVLAVTHDAVVRCALVDARNLSLEALWTVPVENGAYALFALENGRLELREACINTHLAGLRANTAEQAL